MTRLKELEEAQEAAQELQRRIEASSLRDQLQPRIDHIMDGIDEAAALLEATPEYQVFRDRLHVLALVLQEAGDLLEA